jgi:hypothetical protein
MAPASTRCISAQCKGFKADSGGAYGREVRRCVAAEREEMSRVTLKFTATYSQFWIDRRV